MAQESTSELESKKSSTSGDREQRKNKYALDDVALSEVDHAKGSEPSTIWMLIKGFAEKKKFNLHADADNVKGRQRPLYLKCIDDDIQRLSARIAETPDHHCYMKIEIGFKSQDFKKDNLIELVKIACKYCTDSKFAKRLIIYYTGHGQPHTGDWVLHPRAPLYTKDDDEEEEKKQKAAKEAKQVIEDVPDGCISLDELFGAVKLVIDAQSMIQVGVIADCCYSHGWVLHADDYRKYLRKHDSNTELYVLSATVPPEHGGSDFTLSDGKFMDWLLQERKEGRCFTSNVDKNESFSMIWDNGNFRVIRHRKDADSERWAKSIGEVVRAVITAVQAEMPKLQRMRSPTYTKAVQEQIPQNAIWHQRSQ